MHVRLFFIGVLSFFHGLVWAAGPPTTTYTLVPLGTDARVHCVTENNRPCGEVIEPGFQRRGAILTLGARELIGTPGDAISSVVFGTAAGRFAGRATGNGPAGIVHGILWTPGSGVQFLGTLGGPELLSQAQDVNTAGLVCGSAERPSDHEGAAALHDGSGWSELPRLGTATGGSCAALNEAGEAVGASIADHAGLHCAFWNASRHVYDCDPGGTRFSAGEDVNASGLVVGSSLSLLPNFPEVGSGFAWTAAGGATFLPPLAGDTDSRAHAVNNAGVIVGTSLQRKIPFDPQQQFQRTVGVRWDGTTPTDLNTLVAAGDTTLKVLDALAINTVGAIGAACLDAQGQAQGCLLIPIVQKTHGHQWWLWWRWWRLVQHHGSPQAEKE